MNNSPKRRVVVTGLGAVSNVGVDVPSMWDSLINGRSGIGPITAFEQNERFFVDLSSPGGAVIGDGRSIVTVKNDDPKG